MPALAAGLADTRGRRRSPQQGLAQLRGIAQPRDRCRDGNVVDVGHVRVVVGRLVPAIEEGLLEVGFTSGSTGGGGTVTVAMALVGEGVLEA